jgi:ATP-dependent DNA helicase RecQ
MREPRIVVRGFDRPNIRLTVDGFSEEEDERQALIARVVDAPKPGIVYAATRKHAEELAAALGEQGVNAVAYHAGWRPASAPNQEARPMWSGIVATTAFGMGSTNSTFAVSTST